MEQAPAKIDIALDYMYKFWGVQQQTVKGIQLLAERSPNNNAPEYSTLAPKVEASCPYVDLAKLGVKYFTDKVVNHNYQHMYTKYFNAIRCNKIKLLEIGLGCDTTVPGASYNLWLEYFPNAEIYFIEKDQKCVDSWKVKNDRVKVFTGDQADRSFLKEFVKQSGEFDYIIDGGAHFWNQQIASLEELFPAVKPGGIYFIEDIHTSMIPQYGNGSEKGAGHTTVDYIQDITWDVINRANKSYYLKRTISSSVLGVDCVEENCALTKLKAQ